MSTLTPPLTLPMTRPGMRIGLLGGSFDPPHEGHVHITREALKRFDLDRVWWLISPGNPLKSRGPAPMAQRMAAARGMIHDPRVHISDIEAQIGSRYTADTLQALIDARRAVRFVWLMGADNLDQLDQWRDWRGIMGSLPVGVLARPGARAAARSSKAARIYARDRLPASHSHLLADCAPPAWCFINVPMSPQSSTKLRQQGKWPVTND